MEYTAIPTDDNDSRFTKSFGLTEGGIEQAKDFFELYGFVVFDDVYEQEQCQRTIDAMWNIVEKDNEGLDRAHTDSWVNYKQTGKYGLSMRGPCFDSTLVSNRHAERLEVALKAIIGEERVMVSHDRYTIYRATQVPGGSSFITGDKNIHLDMNPWWWCEKHRCVREGLDTLEYKDTEDFVKENNYVSGDSGRHVQCILNFQDNTAEDGGTILVPCFHSHIEQWCQRYKRLNHQPLPWLGFDRFLGSLPPETPEAAANEAATSGDPVPVVGTTSSTAVAGDHGNNIECSSSNTDTGAPSSQTHPRKYPPKKKPPKQFTRKQSQQELALLERAAHEELLALSHRIPLRQGSVLIWDQRMMHGSSPNDSLRCRFAQFLKAFGVSHVIAGDGRLSTQEDCSITRQRLCRRALALKEAIGLANCDCTDIEGDTINARRNRMFGLDIE